MDGNNGIGRIQSIVFRLLHSEYYLIPANSRSNSSALSRKRNLPPRAVDIAPFSSDTMMTTASDDWDMPNAARWRSPK